MSSSARLRAHHASQSTFTFRQADHVLAHRPLEQAEERPLHTARVAPGQIDRGDQRLGLLRQALVARQRLRPPLGGPAVLALDPGTRHLHCLHPERADELALTVPVAIPFLRLAAATVAAAAEEGGQLLLEHRLDHDPDVLSQTILDRIVSGLSGQ